MLFLPAAGFMGCKLTIVFPSAELSLIPISSTEQWGKGSLTSSVAVSLKNDQHRARIIASLAEESIQERDSSRLASSRTLAFSPLGT